MPCPGPPFAGNAPHKHSSPKTPLNPADLIRHEADLIEAGLTLQAQGMQLLLAEMRALAGLIPGAVVIPAPASDSETEAGFDNMPV